MALDDTPSKDDPVLQTVQLGSQWPTVDPFLFCAHHRDAYPKGDGDLAPDAPLTGRTIGQDFADVDGWNMYHGSSVPGFPQHPHRGFETVTYVREGLVDHSDSLGAIARFGQGDVQWLTAGSGIVHCEMFPLVDTEAANPLHLFQIWLNLPAADKFVDPYFTMVWNETVPREITIDDAGRTSEITVLAGSYAGSSQTRTPPDSWAARAESDLAIWHVELSNGASWTLPPAVGADTIRTLYLYDGGPIEIGDAAFSSDTGIVLRSDRPVTMTDLGVGARAMILQGKPIGEPVVQHGPFVMNDEAGIHQALADYQRTGFGGWPWPSDDPTHGQSTDRFARHADGRHEDAGK